MALFCVDRRRTARVGLAGTAKSLSWRTTRTFDGTHTHDMGCRGVFPKSATASRKQRERERERRWARVRDARDVGRHRGAPVPNRRPAARRSFVTRSSVSFPVQCGPSNITQEPQETRASRELERESPPRLSHPRSKFKGILTRPPVGRCTALLVGVRRARERDHVHERLVLERSAIHTHTSLHLRPVSAFL